MVTAEAITRSVQTFWAAGFSASATVYPGQQADTSALEEWVELWIESWEEAVRRDASPHIVRVNVTVHCFSRSATAATRVQELADAARDVLARQTIVIRDYDESGTPVLGHVRLREAEMHDMTRPQGAEHRGVLRHAVVAINGRAESLAEAI
ncbi:MAG: hypothetical protein DWQ34_06095 [Planctomycetota bacterium]|nr:MAG: hypothetical protein DWQ29_23285 [Planctomycetota bacterium]REJ95471.1 MAG: hypothetical protein DWQ34_06095 [Planctomycetota bacterium]REK26534.1 MAG: hypothetical protein DWQ41_09725 [Planctomycetota bacterium]REK33987.1 MAG: hypothetical protein DWQ45_14280 [Planctomycetota bacterium]